jgi:uncharacterized damage-inducible protein DinB
MTTPMNEIERIIDQLRRAYDRDAWHGPPLRAVLAGVSAEIASARPIRDAHSIREIVRHVTFWYDGVRRRIGGEVVDPQGVEEWPEADGAGEDGWGLELADLDRAHAALLGAVEQLGIEDLELTVPGKPYSVYILLHGLVQHNLYHAGQIALLKKAAGG